MGRNTEAERAQCRVAKARARLESAVQKQRDVDAKCAIKWPKELNVQINSLDADVVAAVLGQIDLTKSQPFTIAHTGVTLKVFQHDTLADSIYIPKIRTKSDIIERRSIGLFNDYRKALRASIAVLTFVHALASEWMASNHPTARNAINYYSMPPCALTNTFHRKFTGFVVIDEIGAQAAAHALEAARRTYPLPPPALVGASSPDS